MGYPKGPGPFRMLALKPQRYGTRQLKAGDEFEVDNHRQARLLNAIKRADYVAGENVKITGDNVVTTKVPEGASGNLFVPPAVKTSEDAGEVSGAVLTPVPDAESSAQAMSQHLRDKSGDAPEKPNDSPKPEQPKKVEIPEDAKPVKAGKPVAALASGSTKSKTTKAADKG